MPQRGSGASTVVACPLSIATLSCESGTSAKLVDTSVRLVGLRLWNERGVRQNECETRCWLMLERVRNSLLESNLTPKSQIFLACSS